MWVYYDYYEADGKPQIVVRNDNQTAIHTFQLVRGAALIYDLSLIHIFSLDDPMKAAKTMTDYMNIMAAGTVEGSAEIKEVAEALKQTGSVAKTFGCLLYKSRCV